MTKTINKSTEQEKAIFQQILQEIQLIPPEQQENLLHIIQTFRQAITHQEQIKKNKVIIELLDKWEAEGDEQEQTETLNYLQQVLS